MMIDYLIASNPDQRIIDKSKSLLDRGELIVLPTDTSWVIVANPFHKASVDKIYKLKGEEKSHHFSLICSDISMASDIALIGDDVYRLIKRCIPGHYTFIFDATKKMIKALKASKTDHEVGIRFVPSTLVTRLLETTCYPLMTTNITHKMLGCDDEEDIYSYHIEDKLKGMVSRILDPGEYHFVGESTIYYFVDGERECRREGAGEKLF